MGVYVQYINKQSTYRWNTQSVLHLAAMFKDITLTSEELKFVLEKILRMMRELELADLPALVYQLLLLSTKVDYLFPLSMHAQCKLIL